MVRGEVIWITGASSGIGRELTRLLASKGNRVIASARSADALHELEQEYVNISGLACDVTDKASMAAAATQLKERFGAINRVVVNAGTCEYLNPDDPDWGMMERVMSVNFFGAVNTVEAALPLLRGNSDSGPQIVAVSSLVTEVPFPRAEAYGASKAAVQYFFESLSVDLAPAIDVTIVQPGFVDTPLTRRNDFPMPFLQSAEQAAARIAEGMESREQHVRFPWRLSALLSASRRSPGLWHRFAVAKLRRRAAQ